MKFFHASMLDILRDTRSRDLASHLAQNVEHRCMKKFHFDIQKFSKLFYFLSEAVIFSLVDAYKRSFGEIFAAAMNRSADTAGMNYTSSGRTKMLNELNRLDEEKIDDYYNPNDPFSNRRYGPFSGKKAVQTLLPGVDMRKYRDEERRQQGQLSSYNWNVN